MQILLKNDEYKNEITQFLLDPNEEIRDLGFNRIEEIMSLFAEGKGEPTNYERILTDGIKELKLRKEEMYQQEKHLKKRNGKKKNCVNKKKRRKKNIMT